MNAPTSRCNTTAQQLPLAGIIAFSPTDWPGKLVATAFTQGCPLACCYCHNPSLQETCPGTVAFTELTNLLAQRHGLLDGAVISGGEPLMHAALGAAIAEIHRIGFPVGLHTSGYAPNRLAALLNSPDSAPDWVGLDIKGLPETMQAITGCAPRAARGPWDCLRLLSDAGVDTQVRTTVWPRSEVAEQVDLLTAKVAAFGAELVVQQARNVDSAGRYLGATPQ
ncbi:anaerobic ribonucleoside-triphosphate reductase activating protein [Corynebacterium epidermidicanis]|uniref:Anaerobic ribonucleoside-triphosphate reductase activating protein n=1 Tax=Corynebacterium epidermidicanis TaxID=1050174 RepID=A0A0G3GRQ7_9CORY|nr:anaerobic ribonucleoside-triphosphate reductase activating protein [Corynebacterium epidermidicanis]AKK02218.1 anaerobic ribonucleoside-triphosphate reductase activating protein [Corynebacterium epidermidicanis]